MRTLIRIMTQRVIQTKQRRMMKGTVRKEQMLMMRTMEKKRMRMNKAN